LKVDGRSDDVVNEDGFVFLTIDDENVTLDLKLDMSVKFMRASNRVRADFGQVAIQRGPVVYAAEQEDNEAPLWLYKVNRGAKTESHYEAGLLDGVEVVEVAAQREPEQDVTDDLYTDAPDVPAEETQLTLIPYYAWANRADGQMQVWLQRGR
jgi:DUF1680 family protein